MKLVYVFFFLSLLTKQGVCQEVHPAFRERISERNALVYNEVANYPGIKIGNSEVLKAMAVVPRHYFVPDNLQEYAYMNSALPIGYEQTISQPVIVASMTELLEAKAGQKILEIGTGSGYQAAILAEMDIEVYSIEIIPELGKGAKKMIEELGYDNVHIRIGDGYMGWPEQAPFDGIIVTCAPEKVPEPLVDQLKLGGRLVIPIGSAYRTQYLVVLQKDQDSKMVEDRKYPVRFVPMTGKAKEK